MWRQFRPEFTNDSKEKFTPSPSPKFFGGIYSESDKILTFQLPLDKLWDINYSVQKLCRFNQEIFYEQSEKLDGNVFDRGII
jgi:hypothetical protein